MAKIKTLTDNQGVVYYPKSSAKAVYDTYYGKTQSDINKTSLDFVRGNLRVICSEDEYAALTPVEGVLYFLYDPNDSGSSTPTTTTWTFGGKFDIKFG